MEILENNLVDKLEPVSQLFKLSEGDSYLMPISNIGQGLSHGKFMEFEMLSDEDDGTFPLVMHYVNLLKRIDRNGSSGFLN